MMDRSSSDHSNSLPSSPNQSTLVSSTPNKFPPPPPPPIPRGLAVTEGFHQVQLVIKIINSLPVLKCLFCFKNLNFYCVYVFVCVCAQQQSSFVVEQGSTTPTNGDSTPTQQSSHGPPPPPGSGTSIARKESYKLQRKNYRVEKKKAANELLSSHKDPAAIVLADWLKGTIHLQQLCWQLFIFSLMNWIDHCSERDVKELDKTVVYLEAGSYSALQERQNQGTEFHLCKWAAAADDGWIIHHNGGCPSCYCFPSAALRACVRENKQVQAGSTDEA